MLVNKKIPPLKAIKAHCLDCSCWSKKEVQLCVISDCPLYPYRFGKNSARKGIGGSPKLINQETPTQVDSFDKGTALGEGLSGNSP